ncbi:hypothetical protein BDL97_11G027900 [Sphagnum fallax]|nr:hypothetical protein BDL97_11G027900 [Sphagnum fallax]
MWGDGVVFNAKFCLFFLSRFFCRCRSHKLISYQQQIADQEQEREEVSQKGEMLGDSQPHMWLRWSPPPLLREYIACEEALFCTHSTNSLRVSLCMCVCPPPP